jgi:hypothetical protein
MTRLNAKWSDFTLRGEAWDSWWQDGPTASANASVQPVAAAVTITTATPAIVAQNYILVQPAAAAVTIAGATPAVGTPVSIAPSVAAMTMAAGYQVGTVAITTVQDGSASQNEIQQITVVASGGTWRLQHSGAYGSVDVTVAYGISAADLQALLAA